jgi:diguanylate cyclase (GGDEF)-like protein
MGSYTKEQLKKYPYFAKLLESVSVNSLLDSLTGILSRPNIIGFARYLIDEGIPFSIAMMDLDNFKFINDTYGHNAGDGVLIDVCGELAAYLDGYGLAGRFGGDEILFINLRDVSYEDKKKFFVEFYDSGRVLRKNVNLPDCDPFITATVGCASFPEDSTDYDGLFSKIDKTLYRGKVKGRNCYIIYVDAKHRDLEIRHLTHSGIYSNMQSLVRQFEQVPKLKNKLHSVLPFLEETLQITDLYYVGKTGILRNILENRAYVYKDVSDIANLTNDDMYSSNNLASIERSCPKFFKFLKEWNIETVMVCRVGLDEDTYGYLVCAEPNSRRIWQEHECALLYFLAKLIAGRIRIDGESL